MFESAEQLADPTSASNIWRCPVCSVSVARPLRPGRRRVYCSNSCKQRAYRWRCEHRAELTTPRPPIRAQTYDKTHAMRSDNDFVGHRTEPSGRRVTVCGTFAHSSADRRGKVRHTRFYAVDEGGVPSGSTCRRCVDLLDVPLQPIEEVMAEIAELPARPSLSTAA